MLYRLFVIFFLLFVSYEIFADDAPLEPTQSGTVIPIQHKSIQMVKERVDIYLYKTHYKVKVVYYFKNYDKKQKVVMGFPNRKTENNSVAIRDFAAWDGENKLKVYQKDQESKIKNQILGAPFYECTDIVFNKGEVKKITNTYSQDYMTDYDLSFNKMEYILKTGALWYKKIKSIEVYIHFIGIAKEESQDRTVIFADDPNQVEKSKYKFSLLPKNYTLKDNKYILYFKNINPDFNIEMKLPPLLRSYAKASSFLKSQKFDYKAENLIDNNPNTAWIEGKADDGIGESFLIDFSSGRVITAAYYIDEIAFVNGYNKSKDLFLKNNRVKKLEISYQDYISRTEIKEIITLKDTMEKQIIKLPKQAVCFQMKFKILDIYKGTKYNDTALSEIYIYPLNLN